MNELSLFTGAGGGILGTHLLGWRPIGYVEWDDYCQRVLAARIADGLIPAAPIFGDVREFVQSGAAEQYRGFADVVTAGFPCQPFSVAGKQRAADDERNMWPATRDVIRVVRPRVVDLENVPGLLTCGYAGVVIADLAAMGYVGRYGCVSAADTGAPHLRKRWWVVAHATGERSGEARELCERQTERLASRGEVLADAGSIGREGIGCRKDPGSAQGNGARRSASGASDADVSNAEHAAPSRQREHSGEVHTEPVAIRLDGRGRFGRWPAEPEVGRVAHGVADRVGQLRALGNGQVPRVVAAAWELLA